MADKTLCPWCGAEMTVNDVYFWPGGYYSVYTECAVCHARGPEIRVDRDPETAYKAAQDAAKRREKRGA